MNRYTVIVQLDSDFQPQVQACLRGGIWFSEIMHDITHVPTGTYVERIIAADTDEAVKFAIENVAAQA